MALETVDILVEDDEVVPNPVDNVTVRVYDAAGTTFITEGVTGSAGPGHVEFTLEGSPAPDPEEYQLRFFITGGSIKSPQKIEVYSPPSDSPTGTNNFKVTATLFTLPVASDIRMCRVSGFIRGPAGRVKNGLDIHIIPEFNPLVVDDQGVLGERVAVRTDDDGYVEFDLFRNGIYRATVESMENWQREIVVPDRSSVNINHLLFPIVVKVAYDPSAPFTVASGDTLTVTPTVTASDFRVLEDAGASDVIYSSGDTSILGVTVSGGKVTLHGVSPGTTTLDVKRRDESIVYVPDPGIDGGSASVTVT